MKNTFKRMLALVLSLVMVLSLVACGSTQPEETEPASADVPTQGSEKINVSEEFDARAICEGVTLTIAVPEDDEVSTWDDNLMTKLIEEALGVELKFQTYPAADFGDKLNVMINGGDELPDMIWGAGTPGLNDYYKQWIAAEALIPLNKYYEDHNFSKNFWESCEKCGIDLTSIMIDAEGQIWYAPKYFQYPNSIGKWKLWIQEEYAAKLGFDELPTTTEGFYELCKAFAEAGDMNGNGIDDEVAYTGNGNDMVWFKFLMSAFAYAWDDYYLDVEDGELNFAYTSDEWKEGLKYIKKFMDEGIIDTTVLTNDAAAMNAIHKNKEMPCLTDVYYYAQTGNPNRLKYGYVTGLSSEYKEAEAYHSPIIANCGAVVTVDCKNPDAAFLVLDFMMSEEMGLRNRYGVEGVHWDYWENINEDLILEGFTKDSYKGRLAAEYPEPLFIAYNDGAFWGTGEPRDTSYMQAGPAIGPQNTYWGIAVTYDRSTPEGELKTDINEQYVESILVSEKAGPDEHVTILPMTTDEIGDVTEIQATLNNYLKESIGAFLTGQWDIDEYWDTYLDELEKIGIDEALAIYQEAFDRTK